MEADPNLWDVRAGRVNGKSHHAQKVNREIDKINVTINARYKEIVSIRGQATANDVKNAFQGTAKSQETLLKVFHEYNEAFEKKVGVTHAKSTFENYQLRMCGKPFLPIETARISAEAISSTTAAVSLA